MEEDQVEENDFFSIDQSNNEELVIKQILEDKENYIKTDVNSKLFEAYSQEKSYSEIMIEFFNSGTEIKSYRKII